MKYDEEYGTFKFNCKDMEIVLNALSYSHANNGSLSHFDKNYIDGLYESLNNAGKNIYAS